MPNMLCQLYLTIMRGTPTMVQLLIIYYVVFASASVNKILVAVIAFGLNSAAYIAEVIRSGIMSVDNGRDGGGQKSWSFVWQDDASHHPSASLQECASGYG